MKASAPAATKAAETTTAPKDTTPCETPSEPKKIAIVPSEQSDDSTSRPPERPRRHSRCSVEQPDVEAVQPEAVVVAR